MYHANILHTPVKGRQVPLRMMDYWYQDTARAELFQLPDER